MYFFDPVHAEAAGRRAVCEDKIMSFVPPHRTDDRMNALEGTWPTSARHRFEARRSVNGAARPTSNLASGAIGAWPH